MARPTSPTYARLSLAVAEDPDLAAVLATAAQEQRNPVLLFAAVHWLLLTGTDHPLGTHYATVAGGDDPSGDLVAEFTDFVATHESAVRHVVATRTTQTNEVGRGTVLLPGVAMIADEAGTLGLVDLGASAGLNLLMDRWTHRWTLGRRVVVLEGDPSVRLDCRVEGRLDVPSTPPPIAWRMGLDRSPVDLVEQAEVDWLLACVWPDAIDRFERLQAAIEVARRDPPTVRRGDVVEDLAEVLAEVPAGLHPVATTSWVLNYLPHGHQDDLLATLDAAGAARDLTLLTMESPQRTPGLPWPAGVVDIDRTVVALFRWRGGRRDTQLLATAHPHGHWMDPTLRRRI